MRKFLLGMAIAGAILCGLLHRVELGALGDALIRVDLRLLGIALGLKLVVMHLKARRWTLALNGGAGPIRRRRVFGASMIGYAGNVVLPARLGEVARVLVVSRHNDLSRSQAISSVGVTQMLDLLVLAAYFVLVSALSASGSILGRRPTVAVLVATATALVIVLGLAQCRHASVRARFEPWLARLPARWGRRATGLLDGLIEGLRSIGHSWTAAVMLWHTLLVWFLETMAMVAALLAFGIAADATIAALLVVTLNLSFAVPLTPGNIGTHQLISVFVLSLVGVGRVDALSFSVGYQGAVHLLIILLGGAFFFREGLSLGMLRREAVGRTRGHDGGDETEGEAEYVKCTVS